MPPGFFAGCFSYSSGATRHLPYLRGGVGTLPYYRSPEDVGPRLGVAVGRQIPTELPQAILEIRCRGLFSSIAVW